MKNPKNKSKHPLPYPEVPRNTDKRRVESEFRSDVSFKMKNKKLKRSQLPHANA